MQGDGFVAQHMTIQNTAGPENKQAVALLSETNHSPFHRVKIDGYKKERHTIC